MATDKYPLSEESEPLPDTLTPKVGSWQGSADTITNSEMPWGRLITCRNALKSLDLLKTFCFGRGENCSVVVTESELPKNVVINISKRHFEIYKNEEDNLVYITDLSKNGTYVNAELIGQRKRKILSNQDVISVSVPDLKVYVFLTQGCDIVDDFFPKEIQEKFASIRNLGRGSCGEVRLVKDRATLKEYAIKKILLGASNTSQMHKINHPNKVYNEIYLLRTLNHPFVISMADMKRFDKEIFIVLEFMRGGELTSRILSDKFNEDLAKFYFIQMVIGVQYLHSQNVIHRDLKPENILLLDNREETMLKITDFGLSKLTDHDEATTMCGTLRYVAPEVISSRLREYGEYGKEVDVWSLGVILYFMLCKTFPFGGEENTAIVKNIVKGKFNLSKGIWREEEKEQVKDLLANMLKVRPVMRIKIVQIFQHAWIRHKLSQHGVKHRVKKLLAEHGVTNPMEDLSLEPSPKKFKFEDHFLTVSSDESSTSLTNNVEGREFTDCPTLCC